MTTYTFTAYAESDLTDASTGSNIGYGDVFTVPGAASVEFQVTDNDAYLSGDSYHNENANDHSGQTATITDASGQEVGNGGQIYGEQYFWVYDSSGQWYLMIEIEQEGSGDDYFAFHSGYGTPAAGTSVTVYCGGNISCWEPSFDCLEGGSMNALADADEFSVFSEDVGLATLTNVLDNTVDPEAGDPVVYAVSDGSDVPMAGNVGVAVAGTNGGIFVINADGSATFVTDGAFDYLNDGQSATTSVTYCVMDADGKIVESTYTVQIDGANEVFVIDADEDCIIVMESETSGDIETLENGTTTVLANDTVNGQAYTGTVGQIVTVNGIVGNAGEWIELEKGRILVNTDGSVDFDAQGDYDYLNDGEEEIVWVSYTIEVPGASSQGASATALGPLAIKIRGENESCTIDVMDDTYSVGEVEDIADNILTNDLFNNMTPTAGDITVVNVAAAGTTLAANAGVGTAFEVTTNGGRTGTVTINSDGTFTFDGGNNFVSLNNGDTDSFQLTYTGRAACADTQKHNLLFVLDISNSTVNGNNTAEDQFDGENVADLNGDGISNSVLDAQIAGVLAAIQNLIDQGVDPAMVDVGIVTFSGQAQGFTTVDAETLGTWALDSAGLTAALTGIQSGGWTNYEAGLQEAEGWLAGQQGDGAMNQVYFLSDGRPAVDYQNGAYVYQDNSNYGDEVAAIATTYGADIHAIGVGGNSDLQYLNDLDTTGGAEQVLDLTSLSTTLQTNTNLFIEDTATITVTINGEGVANLPPDARDNDYTLGQGIDTYDGNFISDVDAVAGVDSDPENDTLTLTEINGAAMSGGTGTFAVTTTGGLSGSISATSDGAFTFTLDAGQSVPANTTDTVNGTYSITDGNGGSDTAGFSLELSAGSGAPSGPQTFNIVFVVDVSASMYQDQGGIAFPLMDDDNNGVDNDYNGDGRSNQAIDLIHYGLEDYLGEIAAYQDDVPGSTFNLSFVGFSGPSDAAVAMDPKDANAVNTAFASLSAGTKEGAVSNFHQGLMKADSWFDTVSDAGENNIVYFLSDGDASPGPFEAQAIALETDHDATIYASYVGPAAAADYAALDVVDSGSRSGETFPATLANNEAAIDAVLDTDDMIFNLG